MATDPQRSCDPGQDWTEAGSSSLLRAVGPWTSSNGEVLVFQPGRSATLGGNELEWLVMAKGNRELGSLVRLFADPPENALLALDEAGSVTLNAGKMAASFQRAAHLHRAESGRATALRAPRGSRPSAHLTPPAKPVVY